jgi:sialate O-acetylesterase
MKHYVGIIICVFLLLNSVDAKVKPGTLFSDHMVLQKGIEVPVWGTADEGGRVSVHFHGQTVSTIAKNGKWMVKLEPLPYVTIPETMTITGNDTIIIRDILVGEVWLCSGQSNMERQLGPRPPQPLIKDWEKERDAADYPAIREYYVPLKYSKEKINDVNSIWTVCSPRTVSDFSAVGYFFARDLYKKLNVPVGIIFSAYGGTPAEDWMSEEALETDSTLSEVYNNYDHLTDGWKPDGKVMSGLYNGMIYPLIPFAIKGVAWYQGESNVDYPKYYRATLSSLITNWRKDFNEGNFPFLIVQITPHKDMIPELREAQRLVAASVPNTALIVTTDCGDANEIHAPHKQPVGKRLTLAARALAYGEKIEYSGPMFKSYEIKENKIIIHFIHAESGIVAQGESKLKGFTIAGANKNFVSARAIIKGNTVVVSNKQIKKPVAVRYGWANVPDVNLFNGEGLPASPFRTDTK